MNFDLGSNYKILKYKLKLKNAIDKNNHTDIKKYYSHLKYHIMSCLNNNMNGGINSTETKYDFRELDNLLKSNNIKDFEKSTLFDYKKFIIGDKSEEDINNELFDEYNDKYLTSDTDEYYTKLSFELDKIIKVGCDIERIKNSGVIEKKPEYSNQCFWISIIDFLKTKNILVDIEQIRIDAGVENTPKNFDTNFEKGIYLLGAARIASKYNLTIVIYNIDTSTNKIINSPYGLAQTEMLKINNGNQIVIISNQNNAHFELINSVKCNGSNIIDTLDLIWDNTNNIITTNKDTSMDTSMNTSMDTNTDTDTDIEKDSKEVIANIILKKREKIRANFLNAVCSDSDECLGFGKEINIIKKFFDNFENFNYVSEFKSIGTPSANGFIKSIKYEKESYTSYTILKSSIKEGSDNLYYEYLVGNFLNTQSKYFPCFVDTYGLFKYKNDVVYNDILCCNTIANCDVNLLKNGLTIVKDANINIDEYLKESCINPKHISILIQSLKNSNTLNSFMSNNDFCDNELIYVLFQIYMPLSMMSEKFTHYDLHLSNVLIYEPVKGKVIRYNYHINQTQTITFYSPYIVKIIDYGRSYFDDGTINSKIIYDKVCTISECNQSMKTCGKTKGYYWLNPTNNKYNLVSTQKNISYDLRLLYLVLNNYYFESFGVNKTGLSQLKNILYYQNMGFVNETQSQHKIINNVNDIFNILKILILKPQNKVNNDNQANKDLIGDFHIYSDNITPIKFEEYKK